MIFVLPDIDKRCRVPLESLGFHAQQCVEKALKGYLTMHQVSFQRRHDLSYLLDLCVPFDEDFAQFYASADELTPYAVEFRYPDALLSISSNHVWTIIEIAERIYTFVLTRLE